MLYVFLVDNGSMIQLEMNLALETVASLKMVIAQHCYIPPEKQVLLVSGGENLEGDAVVCKYSTGTDTNPIFLFSMLSIESSQPPNTETEESGDQDNLKERLEKSLQLKDSQNTVTSRALLAQEYVKSSTELTRICESLINDQRLQYQGWLAVVANLEDLVTDLRKKGRGMEATFNDYLDKRESHQALIETFDDDVAVLHQIPVFPSLLKSESSESMIGSVVPGTYLEGTKMSLFDWISSRGSSTSLEKLADECFRSVQQMDEQFLNELKSTITAAIDSTDNPPMKEIKGLGERLAGLEQLHLEAKRLVQEQDDIAQSFVQNQQRASGLRDASILPDLCASHKQQLIVMSQNHDRVVSIRNRCSRAKSELSANLHQRMKWVVFIQDQIADNQQTLMLHVQALKRLEKRLEVIEQLHLAPSMYMATVVEVVRRRAFSRHYLEKSAALADTFGAQHSEELALRANYQSKLKKHFLSKMFPGMEDMPPAFATARPPTFDDSLPDITLADVEELRRNFPDLAASLSVPESNALSNLLARSFNQKLTKEEGETLHSLQTLPGKIKINSQTEIGSMSVMNRLMSDNHYANHRRRRATNGESSSESSESSLPEAANGNGGGRPHHQRARRTRSRRNENNLARSLPLEASTLALAAEPAFATAATAADTKSNGAKQESKDVIDKSTLSSTADPSSSTGPNSTANNSSVAPSTSSGDGSVHVQNNANMIMTTANNSKMMDSSSASLVQALNAKIQVSEARVHELEAEIKPRLVSMESPLKDLRSQLAQIRDTVTSDKEGFEGMLADFRKVVVANLEALESDNAREVQKVKEVAQRTRKQSETNMEALRDKLDVEQEKLEDCHREIEIYRQQLESATHSVDQIKAEMIDLKESHARQMAALETKAGNDKQEAINKVILEHEVELESLRNHMENSGKVAALESTIKSLQDQVKAKANEVDGLRQKTRLLEKSQAEKFELEKDKIVQVLEASFAQRSQLAIQENEEALEAKFLEEKKTLERGLMDKHKADMELAMSEAKEAAGRQCHDMRVQFEREYEELQNRQQEISESAVELERSKYVEELKLALQNQEKQLRQKYKFEVDALRARFKMMHSTGAFFDRSPSTSESEQTAESPRQDMLENIRFSVSQEYQKKFDMEKAKFESQLRQMKEDHEAALAEVKARSALKDTAEQQIKFNEALAKAISEKDKEMKEKMLWNSTGPNNEEESKRLSSRIDELAAKNSQLETELKRLKMSQSVMSIQPPAEVALMSASTVVVPSPTNQAVSVTSVDKGQLVVITWDEGHNNYKVFLEGDGSPLHFLHSDSVAALGLDPTPLAIAAGKKPVGAGGGKPGKRMVTGEVVDKEYCQAKKSQNRFGVAQGTKFYRVKCKPVTTN